MDAWWYIAGPALGGALAGLIALAMGGYGGVRQLQRAVAMLAERIEDVDVRVTREVKTRASAHAVEAKRGRDEIVDQLVHMARHPVERISTPQNGAEVLALARQKGLIK